MALYVKMLGRIPILEKKKSFIKKIHPLMVICKIWTEEKKITYFLFIRL